MENGQSRAVPKPGETLDMWLNRIGYHQYRKAIKRSGIRTLIDLGESRLTEVDLVDFGMVEVLPRRRFLAHVAVLYENSGLRRKKMKGVIQQLQDGLVGNKEVEVHHLGRQRPGSGLASATSAADAAKAIARAHALAIHAY